MAKSWAQGSIAGVALNVSGDPVKCFILDGANLQQRRFVSQRTAADGTVWHVGINLEGRGARFGVRFDSLPVDKFKALIQAINQAVDANEPFQVELEDDIHSYSGDVKADFSLNGNYVSYPDQLTNELVVSNVIFRFITQ